MFTLSHGLDAFAGNDSDEVELDIPIEALKAQGQ
jgi:hypothetical protein